MVYVARKFYGVPGKFEECDSRVEMFHIFLRRTGKFEECNSRVKMFHIFLQRGGKFEDTYQSKIDTIPNFDGRKN